MFAHMPKIQLREEQFNIIEEYAALTGPRKLALCDKLFIKGDKTFQEAVKNQWRSASDQDVLKLAKFLMLLKQTAH
jgi:hypothetical protein